MSMLLCTNSKIITIKEFEDGMFQWRIPKELRPVVTKEMEILGLVKKISKTELEISDSKYHPEDLREFYISVGIF
jgi:hypothetical protein